MICAAIQIFVVKITLINARSTTFLSLSRLNQGLFAGRFTVTNLCVSHAFSQPVFPTEFNQSVCAERRDGVMSWTEGSRR